MKSEENNLSSKKLRDAVSRLKEGVKAAKDELDKDGVIKRFEFTFELFWKSLKIFLQEEGIECRSPKGCLKAAFRLGFIQDETLFLGMLEDRNKMAHIYHREESARIFELIKKDYLPAIESVLGKLESSD
ncbi:MAG: nucleotidyltransferase substrate binding protein [Candidatus Omnitrophica bacterium]|nr:nucleotidyltransferase substrate binding protein [Candidatus Omnitrophota bacterium]